MSIGLLLKSIFFTFLLFASSNIAFAQNLQDRDPSYDTSHWNAFQKVRLRALDKITARTITFDLKVDEAVKFGDIFLKVRSCKRPPLIEKEESAAFVQVWEKRQSQNEAQWIFSGWMFASLPSLSTMEHPIYDVWLIECIGDEPADERAIEDILNEEVGEL